VAHNGNLVNAAELRQDCWSTASALSSSSDTEVITMMLAGAAGSTWNERLKNTMPRWQGAYSLVMLTRDGVLACATRGASARSAWGCCPGGWAAASESGALRTLGCEAIREVQPGEIVAHSATAP
jgi:amidophosphoribosyltransferase